MTKTKKLRTKLKKDWSPLTIIMLVVLGIYVVVLLFLLLWAFMTTFKSHTEFRLNKLWLPKDPVWNYSFVYQNFTVTIQTAEGNAYVGVPQQILNSALYALGCAFTNTLVPCLTAYMCAKYRYKFSKVLYATVLITMIVPMVGSLPAEMKMARNLHLYDNVWGLWIMKANFLGTYFLIFYYKFKAMPDTFSEAAKIDGAGHFGILIRIILPLSINTFFTVFLINFITFWNDYQIPYMYLPSHPTLAQGMYHMAGTKENGLSRVPMRLTGAMLQSLPMILIFCIFQDRLMGNLTVGGIKG